MGNAASLGRWICLPCRASRYPTPADLTARRAQMAMMARQPDLAPAVTATDAEYGGVPCLVCRPSSAQALILYFHGGGYRLGSPAGWAAFGSRLAVQAASTVVLADYRLAPEHPFPAAVHDAVAAYQALASESDLAIVLGGDSAGGGLACAVVIAGAGRGVRAPAGLVLLSPWVDLTVRSATFTSRAATDRLFSQEAAQEAAAMYLQGHDAEDPLASPVFADLDGFPPALVFAGGEEVLLADAVGFASRLAMAGGAVELHVVDGMQHVWPTIFPDLPESELALAAMGRFVRRVRARGRTGSPAG